MDACQFNGPLAGSVYKSHLMAQTNKQRDRQTDGYCDSMTESAKCSGGVLVKKEAEEG